MFVVACLGNPGKKYVKNRHNAGFILGEYLARQYSIPVSSSQFSSVSGRGIMHNCEVFLIMPQSYMNKSGVSVRKALEFYKVSPDQLVVVHDDIEVPFGEFRKKFGGGHKGHNGIRSIMQEMGTGDFHRVRFGVGRPENPDMAVADYVLSNFRDEELARIEELLPAVTDTILSIFDGV